MFCKKCGTEMTDDIKFCPNCGQAREGEFAGTQEGNGQSQQFTGYNAGGNMPYNVGPSQKSKLAAGLLQIFLGYFGIGRFYLGYTGIGVAQLLVSIFTCGIGAIWPFVDGILILCGQVPNDANGVPLKD